jgi:hypothetical protein
MTCLVARVSAESNRNVLRPFVTDGCSMFPDGVPGRPHLWQHCCVAHDLAYWKGGTRQDRRRADATLASCVNAVTRNPVLGSLMQLFVRIGGGPQRAGGTRWGFGWTHTRPYGPLSPEEETQVAAVGTPDLAVHRHPEHSKALPWSAIGKSADAGSRTPAVEIAAGAAVVSHAGSSTADGDASPDALERRSD